MTLPDPDMLADLLDRLLAIGAHGPVAGEPGEAREVLQQQPAVRRVVHLGMELHRIEPPGLVTDDRERRARRCPNHLEAGRELGHPVAVAHPDFLASGGERPEKMPSLRWPTAGVTQALPNSL